MRSGLRLRSASAFIGPRARSAAGGVDDRKPVDPTAAARRRSSASSSGSSSAAGRFRPRLPSWFGSGMATSPRRRARGGEKTVAVLTIRPPNSQIVL